ncbi:MAG: nucleotidyltransferase domain-containing protein [Armatimonadetes bacterium]|nr:nucleotidyltransferase domain-containing protein [Armatimonadota bacterium]
MRLLHPLNEILSSPAKVAVLRVLCQAHTPLSMREVVRRSRVVYSRGWKALRELAASGILMRREYGRVHTYELSNVEAPLVRCLRQLFEAEARRTEEAVGELAKRVPEALAIILFGSEARGKSLPGSDTDVLFVTRRADSETEAKIARVCIEVTAEHDLAVSWHVADLATLREWESQGNKFWRSILQEGIRLHGESLEELRRRWLTGEVS